MLIEYVKTGRQRRMNGKVARILEKKGFVRILDGIPMEPDPFQLQVQKSGEETPPAVTQDESAPDPDPQDEFDSMNRDALIAFAEEHNKRIDRRWGDEKIRAELREQNQ